MLRIFQCRQFLKKIVGVYKMTHSDCGKRATCGIIVIGDEILNGSVHDTNSNFLCAKLHSMGIDVPKVSVIRDDTQTIAEEVRMFSKTYQYVITSGGIGPTHDDVTFQGVAHAFGEEVAPHPEILELCRMWFKTDDVSSPAMRLAHVPKSAKLNYGVDPESGKKSNFPIVSVRNVFVFPGVPHLLEKAFRFIADDVFIDSRMRRYTEETFLSCDETSIADKLNSVVSAHPNVKFGSYPEFFHSYYRTRITAEGDQESQVMIAVNQLRESIPKEDHVKFDKHPTENMADKLKFLQGNADVWPKVEAAMNILSECYQRFSPENVVVCFNGGKDCTAVLHLAATVLKEKHAEAALHAIYVVEPRPFPQVSEFIDKSKVRYNMQLEKIPGPIKGALTELLKKRPHIEAAIMGTRLGDPHTDKQQAFSPTDADWPRFVRVNPMLDWSYNHVWQFIRQLYLPYCNLYDRGYTSLGSMDNTFPNPLLYEENALQQRYKPAYMLEDASSERRGRT